MINENPNKILTQPLPKILDEMEHILQTASEASKRAEDAAFKAREATDTLLAAIAKAEKAPLSWQLITIIIITILSSIFAAVAVTLGLSWGIGA